jgi:hypothetical protein
MTSEPSATTIPIVCDMTGAPDTAEERMAEYGRLFARALTGRERTNEGTRLRFRADDGIESWVRDLATREMVCCPFLDIAVSTQGGEVWWHASVVDGVDADIARTILDDLYSLPDTIGDGVAGIATRLNERGLQLTTNATGTVMRVDRGNPDA